MMGLNSVMESLKADSERPKVKTVKAVNPQRAHISKIGEHDKQFEAVTATEIKVMRLFWKQQGKLVCRECANREDCGVKQTCLERGHYFFRAMGKRFIGTLQAVRAARELFREEA